MVRSTGTRIMIEGSIESNVRYFVFASTIDVVIGDDPIYYGAENTTPIPKKHVMGTYAATKHQAELVVMKANGRPLANGTFSSPICFMATSMLIINCFLLMRAGIDRLQTVILRPTVLYGEGDKLFVGRILEFTRNSGGKLQRIDNVFIRCQPTYVGNAAWACIKAKDKLQCDSSIGAEDFFITDDTQILDPYDFLTPYLERKDYHLSKRALPFWYVRAHFAFMRQQLNR